MVELDPCRFFSDAQRQQLYSLARGQCQGCGDELVTGWHADHCIPWANGGPTTIENGQALCEGCNKRKGRGMAFRDEFRPRPFQREVISQVQEGIQSGRRCTVVLASPGSGKTLAYQSLATHLFREAQIDHIAVFVPRVALAQQCEVSWMHRTRSAATAGLCLLFEKPRFGKIWHRTNETPLTPSQPGTGFVATYSALATSERTFLEWAIKNEKRFLLIADEAQFCGASDDNESGGTKAGTLIERLHGHSLHTLLLTGTPYRSDNQALVLAEYNEPEPGDRRGLRTLVYHAAATYEDGIAEGYLRTFEMQLTNSQVTQRVLGDPDDRMRGESTLTYNLSDNGEELSAVLKDPKTWQPLVDNVVTKVRDKQKFNSSYRGLISCMGQNEAKAVLKYLQEKHSTLRVGIAISSDNDAPRALANFRAKAMDILVTVRMAFIGYDCPEITVVGILTHYRDGGHLSQLVGRGLRVWKEMPPREQSCVIVAPDDPKMQEFLNLLRGEQSQGLRRLEEKPLGEGELPEISQPPLSYLESAIATTTRAASNDTDVEADDLMLIESIKVTVDSGEDVTKLKKVLEAYGLMAKQTHSDTEKNSETELAVFEPTHVPKTDKELIEDINARTAETVRAYVYRCGVKPGDQSYADVARRATARVNSASGLTAAQATTVERAERRLRAAKELA